MVGFDPKIEGLTALRLPHPRCHHIPARLESRKELLVRIEILIISKNTAFPEDKLPVEKNLYVLIMDQRQPQLFGNAFQQKGPLSPELLGTPFRVHLDAGSPRFSKACEPPFPLLILGTKIDRRPVSRGLAGRVKPLPGARLAAIP